MSDNIPSKEQLEKEAEHLEYMVRMALQELNVKRQLLREIYGQSTETNTTQSNLNSNGKRKLL